MRKKKTLGILSMLLVSSMWIGCKKQERKAAEAQGSEATSVAMHGITCYSGGVQVFKMEASSGGCYQGHCYWRAAGMKYETTADCLIMKPQ